MSVELAEVTNAVAEFDRVAAGLAALREKYQGVIYDVATTSGMKDAKEARLAVREPRFEVERIRKAAKAPILALGKKLDSEAARITAELLKIEEPIDNVIKAEEARKEREKQEKIEAEMKRVADLQERVAELRGNRNLSSHSGSELIAQHVADLDAIQVGDDFQEFRQQAEDAKAAGLTWLRELHGAAVAHEAEQARIQAEREELARLRAEQAEREAQDRARREAEDRAAQEAREAEARKQAEELARQREEQDLAAKAERDRLAEENRAAEVERVKRETALQEIQAIQHQLLIADMGRAPYCKGGDLESYDWVIAQTEEWPTTEERFGILAGTAQKIKDNTLAQLRERRSALAQRLEQEAAASAERERIAAEERRIAAERAELERQQREAREAEELRQREAERLAREQREREEAAAAEERKRQERRQAMERREKPTPADLADAIAGYFDVDFDIAAGWLYETPKTAWKNLTKREAA